MRRLVMIFLVVAAFAATGADAVPRVRMSGVVRDILGVPIVGATVSEASATTTSGPGGAWELLVDPALVNTITASKTNYVAVSETVVPLAQPTLDFALPFKILPSVTPTSVTSLPATISLEARSLMPVAGNCLIATDDRTGQGVTMTYGSTDPAGMSRWVGGIPLSQSTASGFFHVTFEGRNCSTLQTLTDTPRGAYVVDATPPGVEIITPAEGMLTVAVLTLPSRDGTTRVLGPVFVQVQATDDVGLAFGSIEITPSPILGRTCNENARGATSHTFVCGPFLFVNPGKAYTLTVNVSDLAGKTRTVVLPFRVAGGN